MTGLFITSSRIGDAVMTLSLLEGLRLKNPSMRYTVAADPLVASLFYDDTACDEVISFPKQKVSLHWFNLWKKTCTQKWDWVADTRGSIVSYSLRTNIRHVWKKTPGDQRHKVEQVAAIAGLGPVTPRIYVSDKRLSTMAALLPKGPLFIIAPVANWIGKQWPMGHFKEIIKRFCDTFSDAHVLVVAAPTEDAQLDPLRAPDMADFQARITFSTDLAKQHGLTLIDMAALMERGALFLGNDSGLMHMSYALNVPTIGLFGPSRENIYGPYPLTMHTVLRIPKSYDELSNTPGFSHKSQDCYMLDLDIEYVWHVVKSKFA
jgi:heptosyltransferase-3